MLSFANMVSSWQDVQKKLESRPKPVKIRGICPDCPVKREKDLLKRPGEPARCPSCIQKRLYPTDDEMEQLSDEHHEEEEMLATGEKEPTLNHQEKLASMDENKTPPVLEDKSPTLPGDKTPTRSGQKKTKAPKVQKNESDKNFAVPKIQNDEPDEELPVPKAQEDGPDKRFTIELPIGVKYQRLKKHWFRLVDEYNQLVELKTDSRIDELEKELDEVHTKFAKLEVFNNEIKEREAKTNEWYQKVNQELQAEKDRNDGLQCIVDVLRKDWQSKMYEAPVLTSRGMDIAGYGGDLERKATELVQSSFLIPLKTLSDNVFGKVPRAEMISTLVDVDFWTDPKSNAFFSLTWDEKHNQQVANRLDVDGIAILNSIISHAIAKHILKDTFCWMGEDARDYFENIETLFFTAQYHQNGPMSRPKWLELKENKLQQLRYVRKSKQLPIGLDGKDNGSRDLVPERHQNLFLLIYDAYKDLAKKAFITLSEEQERKTKAGVRVLVRNSILLTEFMMDLPFQIEVMDKDWLDRFGIYWGTTSWFKYITISDKQTEIIEKERYYGILTVVTPGFIRVHGNRMADKESREFEQLTRDIVLVKAEVILDEVRVPDKYVLFLSTLVASALIDILRLYLAWSLTESTFDLIDMIMEAESPDKEFMT